METEEIKGFLAEWATGIFGKTLCPDDKFNIDENIGASTEKGQVTVGITLTIKKTLGYKTNWTDQTTLNKWEKYLKKKIGEHLRFDMRSNRGKELVYISEMRKRPDGEEAYMELPGTVAYNYQFLLEIILRAGSKSNASPFRRTLKQRAASR